MRYQFWSHIKSGEIFAVRLDDVSGREWVTGMVGPLHDSDRDLVTLPDYHYDDIEHDIERAPVDDFDDFEAVRLCERDT